MANVGIYDMTDTWNNAGTAFTAIKMNVTDTASASGSKLLDVQKGGSSYLELNKNGELGILDKIFHLGDTNTAIRFPAADTVTVETAGSEALRIDSSGNVGIGTTSPGKRLEVRPDDLGPPILSFDSDNVDPVFEMQRWTGSGSNYSGVRIQSDGNGVLFFKNSNQAVVGSQTFTERMRITSDGYLRMASGSGGIQFNGDTAAANALDDYEEGTWTPAYAFSTSGSVTYSGQSGKYTKIGRIVIATYSMFLSGTSSPSGNVTLTGLPFLNIGIGSSTISITRSFATDVPNIKVNPANNSTACDISKNATNAAFAALVGSDLGSSTALQGQIIYFIS